MSVVLKKVAITCVLGAILCFYLSLSACGEVQKQNISASLTVLCEREGIDETFSVNAEAAVVLDLMQAVARENGKFSFKGDQSTYGLFLTAVCGVEVSGNEYWAVYTDSLRDTGKGVNADANATYKYNGKTFYTCMQGVSGQPAAEGEHFLLVLSTF